MLRFALASVCLSLSLAACVEAPPQAGGPPGAVPVTGPTRHVAILVPLTGPRSGIGASLVNGAQLALDVPGSPVLDVRDTFGTPEGALGAARTAIASGDVVILGPLTAGEAAAVGPVAQSSGVPVLAFTNDSAVARPGVWALGITPGQQVRRLVRLLRDRAKTRTAGLLPHSEFGRAMESALTDATAEFGLPPPSLREYAAANAASIADGLSELAFHTAPLVPGTDAGTPAGTPPPPPPLPGEAAATPVSPAPSPGAPAAFPYDALLLADTGHGLALMADALPAAGVQQPSTQIIGPALWGSPTSGASRLAGAWYAAGDPSLRAPYEAAYTQKYGSPPPAISDLAYDAAGIARTAAISGPRAITGQPYAGVNGPLQLLPDGRVRRGLAVLEVQVSGPARVVAPTPSGPGV